MENAELNIPFHETLPPFRQQPRALRYLAHMVSFLFHPLFIPTYVTLFLLYVHPYAFISLNEKGKILQVMLMLFTTAFMPAFSVLLMKQLGFIDSVFLRTQRDRIIPYMVVMIYYFSVWYYSKIHPEFPKTFVVFMLSTFIGSIAAMMANIYFKISMHAIAAAALFTFFLWMAFTTVVPTEAFLALATIITGLVCTARFIVSDHSPFEIYMGLLAGIICELIAIFIGG